MPREGKKFFRSVSFVWMAIVIILLVFSGWYFRYRGQAGTTVNAPQIANEVLASGLVGHWTFDGSDIDWDATNEILDRTANNYDGNIGGSLSATSAKIGRLGQALTFNGTSDYIDLGALDVSGSTLTIQAWIFVTDSSGFTDNDRVISKATGVNEADHYWMMSLYDNNALRVRLRTGTTTTTFISEDDALQSNAWQHIAFVYDGATVKLYTNGRDVGGGTKTGTLATSGAVNANIGRNPGSNGNYFPGIIDDVRIYSTALSASDIFQLSLPGKMTVNTPVEDSLSQGLLGYWKMDEGTGTSTTADSSGNANTLSMTGPPTWTTGTIGPSAMDFSGTGQYLSVASPASGVLDFVAGANFSITGWFNRDTFANDHTIVAKRNGQTATDDGYIVYIDDSTDTLVFEASDTADTDEYQRVSTSTFTATGWHQFAVTWNDSATTDPVNIYIDGGLSNGTATGTFANMGDLTESVAFRIGAESDAGALFDGKIDDIRVYSYALSAGEVAKLYQTTAPTQPVDTGLVGHWTFDGPDVKGLTVIDRSGKGNDGIITGAVPTIGKLGQGLSFNGTSSVVTVSNESTFDFERTNPFSVSAWVNRNGDLTSLDPVIAKVNNGGNYQGYKFEATAYNDQLSFILVGTSGDYIEAVTGVFDFTPNEWHHVVATYDGSSLASGLSIFIDAVKITTTNSGTLASSMVNNANFEIGASSPYGSLWGGYIDDLRVYNRALTQTEITNLYNLGK